MGSGSTTARNLTILPAVGAFVVALVLALGTGLGQARPVTRHCPEFRIHLATVYEYKTRGITCRAGHPLIRKWVRTGNYCSGAWSNGSGPHAICVKGRKSISFLVAFDGD